MSSNTSTDNLYVLLEFGSTFAALQRKSSSRMNGTMDTKHQSKIDDPEMVVSNIIMIIEELKRDSVEQKCKAKTLGKIEAILRQIIRDDPQATDHYLKIADEIQKMVKDLMQSQEQSSYSDSNTLMMNDSLFGFEGYKRKPEELCYYGDAHRKLSDEEKNCLSFCYFFLSSFDSSVKIHKRDLIHWWMGMDLIAGNVSNGEQVLDKLVAEEFLQRSTNGKYYSKPAISSKEFQPLWYGFTTAQKDRLYVAHLGDKNRKLTDAIAANKIEVAINVNASTLNARIFEWVFTMTKAKVVHLGSWHQQMDYVVVEDMIVKRLSSLSNLQDVKFLSFRGISRLQKLPTSVYLLLKLKVLDLRACQDLTMLPKGIKKLKQLIHLDLTHCYELEFIPNEIAMLTQLQVLKGFVVMDREDDSRIQAVVKRFKTSSCKFTRLAALINLTKLTIRTRTISFPSGEDVKTLGMMEQLDKLKITWVRTQTNKQLEAPSDEGFDIVNFPTKLRKLELEAAPEKNVLRLLNLISNRSQNGLQKLYIRGGGLSKLEPQKFIFPNIKAVRFRYLSKLHMNWYEFKRSFPKVTQFEMFKCSYLIFFPVDENGVWEE